MFDFKTFDLDIDHLKTILRKNIYPSNFIDLSIKSCPIKLYTSKSILQDVSKRDAFVQLSFLEITLFQLRKKLQKLFTNKLTSCELKIGFTSPVRVKSFFAFKSKLQR